MGNRKERNRGKWMPIPVLEFLQGFVIAASAGCVFSWLVLMFWGLMQICVAELSQQWFSSTMASKWTHKLSDLLPVFFPVLCYFFAWSYFPVTFFPDTLLLVFLLPFFVFLFFPVTFFPVAFSDFLFLFFLLLFCVSFFPVTFFSCCFFFWFFL